MALYNKLARLNLNQQQSYERDQYKQLVPSNPDEVDEANTDDYIYFNFEVNNNANEEKAIELKFDVNRLNPILKNPSSYEYGIERFSSPATIPIFIDTEVKEDTKSQFPLTVEIYDPNVEESFPYPVEVLFNSLILIDGYQTPYENHIKNGVYDYQTLVNAVNLALLTCVNLYNASPSTPTNFPTDSNGAVAPPFIRYVQDKGEFTLYAPEAKKPDPIDDYVYFNQGKYFPYEWGGQPPEDYLPLQIRFSRPLAKLFSGLQQFNFNNLPLDQDGNPDPALDPDFPNASERVLMVIQDLFYTPDGVNNSNVVNYQGVNYRYSTTQWDVRPEMNQFDKILFLTDIVPVKDELLGDVKAVQQRQLFDYIISNRLQNREQINYFPQYIKWSNLQANTELRQFTMQVLLQYRYVEEIREGNEIKKQPILYPLTLQPNERFSAKIVFRKKHPQNVRVVS